MSNTREMSPRLQEPSDTMQTLQLTQEDEADSATDSPASATASAAGSSLLAGIANLLNTVIGAGILSLPYAFKSSGLAVGVAYLLIFGGASWYGSWLLLDALKYRPRCCSYEELASASLGRRGALAYNLASLLNCYGACVAYLVVTGDIVPPLLDELGHPVSRSTVLIAVTIFVIFPLSALRDISALQWSSGLAIVIYICFVITLLCLAVDGAPHEPNGTAVQHGALVKPDAAGWIRSIPLCAFAYLHQTSLFPIYQELRDPSPPRMRRLVGTSLSTAIALYVIAGLAAYARFGEAIEGDILINLATIDSGGVRLMRLAFGVSVCLTYPCLHYAARRSLDQLTVGRVGHEAPHQRLLGLTVLLVGSSLGLALVLKKVELIFGFTGAIASTMISYILPAAIHLMVRPHRVTDLKRNGLTLAFFVSGALCGVTALINHAVGLAEGK